MSDLKPCPFCGAKAYAVHRAWAFAEHWEIQTECAEGCINYGIEPEFNTEEEAEKTWNRRAERTCHMRPDKAASDAMCGPALRCDACGAAVPDIGGVCYCPCCGVRVVVDE